MDVLEFAQKYRRMCEAHPADECPYCPAHELSCSDISEITQELVDTVEKWNREHPGKTRRAEFLKIYPNADVDDLDPCYLEPSLRDSCGDKVCTICREEYWSGEVEQ